MNWLKQNKDTICGIIVISAISTVIYNVSSRLFWLAVPAEWIKSVESVIHIELTKNPAVNVIFVVLICMFLLDRHIINHVVKLKKSYFKIRYRSVKCSLTVKNRKKVVAQTVRQCISTEDTDVYQTNYLWTGSDSVVTSNRTDAVPIKKNFQPDDRVQWILEFRDTKKANKPFLVDYSMQGQGPFKPFFSYTVNEPVRELILRVIFEGDQNDLALDSIAKNCRVGKIDILAEDFDEPGDKEFEYRISRPKLLHTYKIHWNYK